MTGRVVVVTGASSGLGYEVARYLAEGGNDVILACRSEERANRAIEKIKRLHPNALVTFMQLDLASVESVRKFVENWQASGKQLHVLVNNAGSMPAFKDNTRHFTPENFEQTIGTNYLGPFLLTNLLLEELKKAGGLENGDARIINVTCSIHDPDSVKRKNKLKPIDFDNFFLFNPGTHNSLQAYKNSKAALVMFTYELARRLEGTNVTTNVVDPGFIPATELMRSAGGMQKFVNRYILHGLLRFTKATRTVQQGAAAVCALVTDDKFKGVTGKYYKETTEAKSSAESLDEEAQKKLWTQSGGYVKLDGYEAIEVTQPPPEEEPKKEEKKKKEKKEDKTPAADDAAKPAEDAAAEKKEGEEVAAEKEGEEVKAEETKEEKKDEEKTEEKKEVDAKPEVKDEKIVKDEEVDDIEKQKAENKALEAAEAAKNAAPAVAVE